MSLLRNVLRVRLSTVEYMLLPSIMFVAGCGTGAVGFLMYIFDSYLRTVYNESGVRTCPAARTFAVVTPPPLPPVVPSPPVVDCSSSMFYNSLQVFVVAALMYLLHLTRVVKPLSSNCPTTCPLFIAAEPVDRCAIHSVRPQHVFVQCYHRATATRHNHRSERIDY